MKQSEVTHIVMQWPGFFSFPFICRSLFYLPSFFLLYFSFYFHYHLLPPVSLSVSVHGGGKCMLVPRWRGGEINSEAV